MSEAFDFIIVGAGSAGCVVAERLTASGRYRVLVLEAGGSDRSPFIQVPIGYGRTFFDPKINWMYDTDPSPELDGRRSYWPRGKVIGGSGSINAMVYVRGLPSDYDGWAAEGADGWSFADVLPYFKKSERFEGGETPFHGVDGPMHVTDLTHRAHPLCQTFFAAAENLGFSRAEDFNGAGSEGVGLYHINTDKGVRASTANAFLRPARSRSNLELRTGAQVLNITLEAGRATGVIYRRGGVAQAATARAEVILCAGAVNTPHILQVSGIGDPVLLRHFNIPVAVESPNVGKNLQDHLAVSYFFRCNQPTLNDVLGPLSGKIKAGLQYLINRSGPLALSVNQAGGFIRSREGLSAPDLQLYFSPVSYSQTPLAKRELINPDPFSAFLLSFNACRPQSRGDIRLASPDPLARPIILPNYLSHADDIADAQRGVALLRRLAATEPLAGVITEEIAPGAHIKTLEGLMQDFRARADTVYHPVGTARMGAKETGAVVDSSLRVFGLDGLRIIDASVFPRLTSGNTNAPVVMVAEKGVERVLADAQTA